jgi:hypothetical protein
MLMKKHFGDKVAAELQARARDRDTFEEIFRALDSYPARARDRHQVTRMPGRATAQLSYKSVDVCAFYVRKGKIIVHPRSADLDVVADVESAVDRMAILLAQAILDQGDEVDAEEAGMAPGAGPHLVKLADGRRS